MTSWLIHNSPTSLQQAVRKVAALPAQAGGLGMLVEVGRLAEALAALEAGVGLLARVHPDVLLAVGQGEEGLAADLAGVLARPLHHQDVVLRQRLLALGQDVRRGPGELRGKGCGPAAAHVIPRALVQEQGARHARGGWGGWGIFQDDPGFACHVGGSFGRDASEAWVGQGRYGRVSRRLRRSPQGVKAQAGTLEVQRERIHAAVPPVSASWPPLSSTQTLVEGLEEQRVNLQVRSITAAPLSV